MTTCEKCGGVAMHYPGCSASPLCAHGADKAIGKCGFCERDARIAELERQLADARAELESLRQAIEEASIGAADHQVAFTVLNPKGETVVVQARLVRGTFEAIRAQAREIRKGTPEVLRRLEAAKARAERLAALLERAKPEIYLDSHGNPELVREIEEALARKES